MVEPSPQEPPERSFPKVPFTVQDGRSGGLTDDDMRASALAAPLWGVRMLRDSAADPVMRCYAAALLLDDLAAFSHVTALRLLGVEVPWVLEQDERIHVVTRAQENRLQRQGVAAHHTTRLVLDTTVVHGLPVTSPAQTWLHLARDLRLDDLVVLGDAMTRRKRPTTTLDALTEMVRTAGKVKGVVRAREALPLLRRKTDSSMETRLRLVIVRGELPCPLVNEPVRDASGAFVALPDLSYPELKIAIEYNGDLHRTDGPTWRRDVRRRRALRREKWVVLEYVSDDVYRYPERIVAEVRATRAAQAAKLR